MSRTIKELAIEVCDRVTVNSPDEIFGTNDRIARILRVAIKDTLRDIMRDAMRNGVSGFQSQWIFATKPGVYAYKMPPDLYKIIAGTEQRSRWPLGIIGPVNPQSWSNWISGAQYTTVPMGWRIKNNLIHFEPTPTNEEIVVIEYLSSYTVARDATDDDLAPVGGYLQPIAPLVPREGYLSDNAYDAIDTGTHSQWGAATWGASVWGQTPARAARRIQAGTAETNFPAYQVRAENFTKDTDRCAIDDDHIVSLGMTWRLRKGLSMPYAEAHLEYEREKGVFLSNDASVGRVINFSDYGPSHEINPLGDGQWLAT